jgi:hypothetical protein
VDLEAILDGSGRLPLLEGNSIRMLTPAEALKFWKEWWARRK